MRNFLIKHEFTYNFSFNSLCLLLYLIRRYLFTIRYYIDIIISIYQCEFSRCKDYIEDTLSSYENSFKTELTELYNSMKVVYEDTTRFLNAVTYLSNEILSTIEGSGDDSESD